MVTPWLKNTINVVVLTRENEAVFTAFANQNAELRPVISGLLEEVTSDSVEPP